MGPEKQPSWIRGYRMFVTPPWDRTICSGYLYPLVLAACSSMPEELFTSGLRSIGMEDERVQSALLPRDRAKLVREVDRHPASRSLHDLFGKLGHPQLVRRVQVRVPEADGDRIHPLIQELLDTPWTTSSS